MTIEEKRDKILKTCNQQYDNDYDITICDYCPIKKACDEVDRHRQPGDFRDDQIEQMWSMIYDPLPASNSAQTINALQITKANMSFKDRLIDYCENTAEQDCPHCPFRVPCYIVDKNYIPGKWFEDNFDLMKLRMSEYQTDLSYKLKAVEEFLEGE